MNDGIPYIDPPSFSVLLALVMGFVCALFACGNPIDAQLSVEDKAFEGADVISNCCMDDGRNESCHNKSG